MPPRQRRRRDRMDDVALNAELEEKFNLFMSRLHKSTRWVDGIALTELGLVEEITLLFTAIGAEPLLHMNYSSYMALTSEFLSSFSMPRMIHRNSGVFHFRLGNVDRSLTIDTLNGILGFPTGVVDPPFPPEDQTDFWYLLTGMSPYRGQDANGRDIVHPCFRIIYRIFANTIYARAETGNVTVDELRILWSIANGHPVNLGYQLVSKLRLLAKSSAGEILIGGMITPLAMHFGIYLSQYTELGPPRVLDLEHLKSSSIVKPWRHYLCLLLAQSERMPRLPAPEKMSITDPANWYEAWTRKPRPPREDEDAQDDPIPVNTAAGPSTTPAALLPGPASFQGEYSGDQWHQSTDNMAYFREQFGAVRTEISGIRSHVFERLTAWEVQQQQDRIAAQQDRQMQQQMYYHMFGRFYDPLAPFPPPPPPE